MMRQCVMRLKGVKRRRWCAYGRVYRIVKHRKTGSWWAVGRGRGLREHYLDKLGCRMSAEEMQLALDAWAVRVSAWEYVGGTG